MDHCAGGETVQIVNSSVSTNLDRVYRLGSASQKIPFILETILLNFYTCKVCALKIALIFFRSIRVHNIFDRRRQWVCLWSSVVVPKSRFFVHLLDILSGEKM